MVELYKYYFILYLIDINNQITYISNTDPITYTNDIKAAKLYEDNVNADNDIILYYERIKSLIDNTDVKSFYKGYVKVSSDSMEIIISNKVI